MKQLGRREFIKYGAMGGALLAASPYLRFTDLLALQKRKPNIIIIFCDDMGYADIGCFGAKGYTTPNIDTMAQEGMRFTNFYASQAVCSASRASLLTGCYSERVSIRGALSPSSQVGISNEEETIARLLKRKGYKTGIFGKWHLGHTKEFLPLQHGFDEYLGLPYSNDMWPKDYDGKNFKDGDPQAKRYPPLPLIDGNEKIKEIATLDDQAALTTLYTERAVKFIEKNKDKPFFLYLPHSMPHAPIAVSEKFRGKSEQGLYGDVIEEIDWSVGEVNGALKKHKLEKDTLVIFTSDNGPWLNYGNNAGSPGPLREGKGTAFEGGARVPALMSWPDTIPADRICNNIASTIDLLPTISAIANTPLPKKKIDGVNILSLLNGNSGSNPRNHFIYYYDAELRAVREGKWKLVFPHKSRSYSGLEPGEDRYPGATRLIDVKMELYDLENDIGEKNNVIALHPDIVERLNALAEKKRDELGDALTDRVGKEVRPPGRRKPIGMSFVNHLAVGKQIVLTNPPAKRYSAFGAITLIDGKRGSFDFTDRNWLGFEKVDFEALVDLSMDRKINSISCGFMLNQGSWIFLPSSVEISFSNDVNNFQTAKVWNNNINSSSETKIEDYEVSLKNTTARFIKIKAVNIAVCPDWHIGKGGKAWLFADEIIIK